MKNPNLSSAEVDSIGMSIALQACAKQGFEVFTSPFGGTRTDIVLLNTVCTQKFTVQVKSTQGEIIKIGRAHV